MAILPRVVRVMASDGLVDIVGNMRLRQRKYG